MKISSGDTVRITIDKDFWREGTVISATDWGKWVGPPAEPRWLDNWYIELRVTAGRGSEPIQGYGYWKQEMDGGSVEVLKPANQ